MRIRPRQQQRRKTPLCVETFERRDLLSRMHLLPSPLLADAHWPTPHAIQVHDEASAAWTTVQESISTASSDSPGNATDGVTQTSSNTPTDGSTNGASQGSNGSEGGNTGTADSAAGSDSPVNATDGGTQTSSNTTSNDSPSGASQKSAGNADSTASSGSLGNATDGGTQTSSNTPTDGSTNGASQGSNGSEGGNTGNADSAAGSGSPVNATNDVTQVSGNTPADGSTNGASHASDSSQGGNTSNADSTISADAAGNATDGVTQITSNSSSDDTSANAPSTDGASKELNGTIAVQPVTDEYGIDSQAATMSADKTTGDQNGSSAGTIRDSSASLDASAQVPVRVGSSQQLEPPSDQNKGTQGTVGLKGNDAINDAQKIADPSPAISVSVSRSALNNVSISNSNQTKVVSVASATDNVDSNARSAAGDAANREISKSHGTPGDAAHDLARNLNLTTGRESLPSRADEGTTPQHSASDSAALLIGRMRPPESPAGANESGAVSDRSGFLDKATSASAKSMSSNPGAVARNASPIELLATDLFFGGRARAENGSPEPGDFDGSGAGEESPLRAFAMGAGLLGSPLLFDADSLAQEAQQFFEQIEQMGQDAGGLLARMNLLTGSVAIGVAVTGAAVVRRRSQQAKRGMVLESWAGKAFASYPGLGGPWAWQES